jgi:hypothetical protein
MMKKFDVVTWTAERNVYFQSLGSLPATAYCMGSRTLLARFNMQFNYTSRGALLHAIQLQGALQHSMHCSRPCEVRVFLVEGKQRTELTIDPSCALHHAEPGGTDINDNSKVPGRVRKAWDRLFNKAACAASHRARASLPLDPNHCMAMQTYRLQNACKQYKHLRAWLEPPWEWQELPAWLARDIKEPQTTTNARDNTAGYNNGLPIVLEVTRYSAASVALGDLKAAATRKHGLDFDVYGKHIGGGMSALLDERVFDNKAVVMRGIKNHGTALLFASPRLRATKAVVLAAVTKNGSALIAASSELQADVDVVKAAVSSEGVALEFAAPELQDNDEIVAAAINAPLLSERRCAGVSPLAFASPRLKNTYATVRAAVDKIPDALACVSEDLKANRDLVVAAVEKDGNALKHAANCLKSDRSVVLAATEQSGDSLRHASEELQRDRDVFLSAVRSACNSVVCMSENWQQQLDWIITACLNMPEQMRSDREVVVTVARAFPRILQDTPFASDRDLVMQLVRENYAVLGYAAQELKSDRQIALVAVAQHRYALDFVDEALHDDELFMRAAVSHYGRGLEHASERLKCHRGLVMDAVTQQGTALEFASPELRSDKEIVLAALNNTPTALMYVNPTLINDPDILQAAALSALKSAGRKSTASNAEPNAEPNSGSSAESTVGQMTAEPSAGSSAELNAGSSAHLPPALMSLNNTLSLLLGGDISMPALLSQFFHH